MICYFGHDYSVWEEVAQSCPHCRRAYDKFCENPPPGWRQILNYDVCKLPPTFEEWQEEQLIKKQLHDGQISETEAKRQASELKERLRKKHNPTPEELEQKRQIFLAQLRAREPTIFESPSLF